MKMRTLFFLAMAFISLVFANPISAAVDKRPAKMGGNDSIGRKEELEFIKGFALMNGPARFNNYIESWLITLTKDKWGGDDLIYILYNHNPRIYVKLFGGAIDFSFPDRTFFYICSMVLAFIIALGIYIRKQYRAEKAYI